ncbi:type II toxin-antitoxin system VapC family toxin [Methanobrevibacter filiformis]|uniref:tRNA(FMet)-specific endonuclease VapC n=1 Tax=Methanobrevibacter filiformis TaxID=55758 RepID=A0A162FL31_9EURY|nr:type II toxin-antitoxin system VapC family toxin [Methanobrevibacter filiformis]KZX11630.1 tRNA(fMet)-specific endonuclease VapC [Methanobrevibacter filiformis]
MIFLETSFLIGFYVKKDKHHRRAMKIWEYIGDDKKVINIMTLYEFLTVLRKKNVKSHDIKKYYNEILNNIIILEDLENHNKAVENCLSNEIGFFDNLHHVTMIENGIKEIASFDKGFDIFNDIKRIG